MRESLHHIDKRCIFRETFNSEAEVRRNGGVPTGVTFENGKCVCTSTSSLQLSNTPVGVCSIRFKVNYITSANTQYLLVDRVSYLNLFVWINNASTIAKTSGTVYVNGIPSLSAVVGVLDIVITGITLTKRFNLSGPGGGEGWLSTIDLFEIYSGTLTAEEVKNLYENKIYKPFTLDSTRKLILDVNAFDGTIRNRLSGNPYVELLTNGGFDTDTWWQKGSGVSIADGVCHFVNVPEYNGIFKYDFLTIGKSYRITFTIKNYVFGGVAIQDAVVAGLQRTANGTYSQIFTAQGTSFFIATYSGMGGTILDIDDISIKEVIPAVIPTNVQVVKDNDVWAMRFNGITSKITCGSYDTLVGDKTLILWLNTKSYLARGGFNIELIGNGQVRLVLANTNILFSRNNGGTWAVGSISILPKYQNVFLCLTSTNSGVSTLYINGKNLGIILNANAGTPVAGSTITIGTGGVADWLDGLIPSVHIIDGLLTPAEISQLYTNEKYLYGL